MQHSRFPLIVVLAVTLPIVAAAPATAAPQSAPAAQNQNQTRKVWTNADIDVLRERGLLSIVGPEPAQAPAPNPNSPSPAAAPANAAPPPSGGPVYNGPVF